MKETSRVTRPAPNGRDERVIQEYPNGIRSVTLSYAGESWTRYVIVPRSWLLEVVRRYRTAGRRWSDIERWELIPPLFMASGYGGPGRAYSDEPHEFTKNRRFYVFTQVGGLDI